MAGLQRSAISFRRQGSSGLVWDDRFLSGELKPTKRDGNDKANADFRELRPSRSVGSVPVFQRNRSTGGRPAHRMENISPSPSASPTTPGMTDPPSPKLAGCGFCGVFGRAGAARQRRKPNKRRTE